MKPDDQVSVIIPFYCRISAARRLVESFLAEHFRGQDIIWVNDKSDEDTSVMERTDRGRVQIIQNDFKDVPFCCKNIGALASARDYPLFLDSVFAF